MRPLQEGASVQTHHVTEQGSTLRSNFYLTPLFGVPPGPEEYTQIGTNNVPLAR